MRDRFDKIGAAVLKDCHIQCAVECTLTDGIAGQYCDVDGFDFACCQNREYLPEEYLVLQV
jgi:hypothetical protein